MNFNKNLRKYATLAVRTGINIQPGQTLVINSPVECLDFTRLAVEEAYKAGAKEVVVHWNDEITTKYKYLYSPLEIFETLPDWSRDSLIYYARLGAAFLSISASDPELLKGIDTKKIKANQKSRSIALSEFQTRLMSNKNVWSVVSIPTKAWSKKIFSELNDEDAVNRLWNEIFKIVRIDKEDPVAAWNEHKKNLKEKMNYLNNKNLKELHFKNSLGTDFHLELATDAIWVGGADYSEEGIEFIANMPTEEVFSMPKKTGVNGIVHSSKPLNYAGNIIDNFSITFKDGKVVDFTAENGYESLKSLIETDEGSHYLGEVALVPFDSPISNSNIIFFNTLYDENASCHLALGKAYSGCVKNGDNLSEEELANKGANDSLTHVDFMIGTSDLSITAIDFDGNNHHIFRDGNWAF
ncbi:aminopeptidase [Clostridium cavendishii]|nr:aminopeptidase [Clostridium cavendishii]